MTYKVTKLLARAIVALSAALLLSQSCDAVKLKKHRKNMGIHQTGKKKIQGKQPPKIETKPLEERIAQLETANKEDLQSKMNAKIQRLTEKRKRKDKQQHAKKALGNRSRSPKETETGRSCCKWLSGAFCLALMAATYNSQGGFSPETAIPSAVTKSKRSTAVETPKELIDFWVPVSDEEDLRVTVEESDLKLLGDNVDADDVNLELLLTKKIEQLETQKGSTDQLAELSGALGAIRSWEQHLNELDEWEAYAKQYDILMDAGKTEWKNLSLEKWRADSKTIAREVERVLLKKEMDYHHKATRYQHNKKHGTKPTRNSHSQGYRNPKKGYQY